MKTSVIIFSHAKKHFDRIFLYSEKTLKSKQGHHNKESPNIYIFLPFLPFSEDTRMIK